MIWTAQIGYLNKNYGATYLRFFYEWAKDLAHPTDASTAQVYYGLPYFALAYQFRVQRQQGDGHLHMSIVGEDPPPCNSQTGDCPETNFDPTGAWNGLHAELFGETLHPGDDVVGGTNSRAGFNNVQCKNENDNWQTQGWTSQVRDFCYFKLNEVNQTDHCEIWTDPTDHNC